MVRHTGEQWLICGIFAPQGVEADLVRAQIDLAAHQPMRPLWGDLEAVAQQVRAPGIIGAAQEDYRPPQGRMRVEPKRGREGPARWGLLPSGSAARAVGGNVTIAGRQQLREVLEPMALPNLGLPQPVEPLDGVLEAGLARGCEHRYDPQRQAQSAHPSHGVGKLVRPLKHRLVIKLGVVGQPQLLPAPAQATEHRFSGDSEFRPTIDLSAPECGAGEHLNERTIGDLEVFNPIKAIKLGLARSRACDQRSPFDPSARLQSALPRTTPCSGQPSIDPLPHAYSYPNAPTAPSVGASAQYAVFSHG